MSFNEGADLDTSQVLGGAGKAGVAVGGGLGIAVLAFVFSLFTGVDVSSITGTDPFDTTQLATQGQTGSINFSTCKTGADANERSDCRVVGTVNSVQDYWADALPAATGVAYDPAPTSLFGGSIPTACGTASAQTGPFYCPGDQRIYLDTGFFGTLTRVYGVDDGALAQEYVVAHEYGHHVQDLLGILDRAQDGRTGAASNSVRIELQADCLAGVWANHAASTTDADGVTLLRPLTSDDVRSALSAASAVGDDRIQSGAGQRVDTDSWTHGSSEQRQRWFLRGYERGSLQQCDTFAADTL